MSELASFKGPSREAGKEVLVAHAAHPAGGKPGTPGDRVTAQSQAGGAPAPGPQAHPKTVLEAAEINRALTRIAHEIIERTRGAEQVVLLGIPTRGVPLAERLAARITGVEGRPVPHGSLDITMNRDDLRLRSAPPRYPPRASTARPWSWWTTSSTPGGPCARPWTTSTTWAARSPCNWPCWSTVGTANCRSGPTTWARTCRPRSRRWSGSCSPRPTARTRCCSNRSAPSHGPAGAESPGGDDEPAPHLSRRPEQAGRAADTGHRRGACPGGGPAHQEAAHAARAHRGEPVLRGLHQDPHLVRGGGQAAVRRRDQLRRQGLERGQGGEPQGHRAHPGGHGRRRRGGPAQRFGRAAPAVELAAGQRDQRRRRCPRAPDPGAA